MADMKKAVRVALAQRGLEQKDLAERTRMTPQKMSRMVGKGANLKVHEIETLSRALELKASELVALGEE